MPRRTRPRPSFALPLFLAVLTGLLNPVNAGAAVVELFGSDFAGGGAGTVGTTFFGQRNVNLVYARPTGASAQMTKRFSLPASPQTPMALQIRARDDDRAGASHIAIELNGTAIFRGANPFPEQTFADRRFAVPAHLLNGGENELTIRSTEPNGSLANPPWFMVASATLAPIAALPLTDFRVTIPTEKLPFPEPATQPGAPRFKFRGTKGWAWTSQQYLDEIPHLKRAGMNFLMNCYFSMFDGTTPHGVGWEDKQKRNNWWKPFDAQRQHELEQIVEQCEANGITFCFAMHPQIFSSRPMDLASDADFEAFFAHFAWMQSRGVKWFSVSMDDVKQEHAGEAHARFCNRFLKRLRERDPEAQLIFCPTVYANAHVKGHEDYLPALAKEMDPDVYVFWTGPEVVSLTITREDAQRYRDLVQHRLIVWDNYPVNDNAQTLHLGPITGRDPELCEVADGYMANPLYPQSHASRIPLYTMGDFASNPLAYDPARSIGQAILQLAPTPDGQRTLADLVETYPGNLIHGSGTTAFNPVVHEYERITASPSGTHLGAMYIQHLEELLERARATIGDEYSELADQLARDLTALRERQARRQPAQ